MRNETKFFQGLFPVLASVTIGIATLFLNALGTIASAQEAAHDEHAEHDEHEREQLVMLSESELNEFGIVVETAGPGKLHIQTSLPGEVRINADRMAHVVPRLSGVVIEVKKTLGNSVTVGEVMAVLDSRELADANAAYLAARERVSLAESMFKREEDLLAKKVSAEQDFLAAKQALAEVKIEVRAAEQRLHALGFSEDYVRDLPNRPETSLTRYEVTAPFDGTVIEKHIVLGEVVRDDAQVFTIADLRTVWVDLSVYQKDLPLIRQGQKVTIAAGQGIELVIGKIAYIGPIIGESTRTALARVVLPNVDGQWRPGLFVTARIDVDESVVAVLVPRSALQTIEDRISVFVETNEGFEPRPVTVGRTDDAHAEITSGLVPGEHVVIQGAFTLKAELGKGSLSDGHNH